MMDLIHLPEPSLLFRFDQECLDPRDGLTLFGPLEQPKIGRIQWAAVGPRACIDRMKRWVRRIQGPVLGPSGSIARPLFPGFEAVFRTVWDPNPSLEIEIPSDEITEMVRNADKHQRTYRTAELFVQAIREAKRNEECTPDVWCVLIPEEVFTYCRPLSRVPTGVSIKPSSTLSRKDLKASATQPFLFQEMTDLKQEYEYEANFHHQLKARLLENQVAIQIIRESKIAGRDELNSAGVPIGPDKVLESSIAWNLSTAIYYKAGGKPWKLGAGREGVCYIGLVFKQLERAADIRTACCAAQMFLNSGDGVVFRGAVGPWYNDKRGTFHLNQKAAKEIVQMCIDTYKKLNGNAPRELFIHGQVNLHYE